MLTDTFNSPGWGNRYSFASPHEKQLGKHRGEEGLRSLSPCSHSSARGHPPTLSKLPSPPPPPPAAKALVRLQMWGPICFQNSPLSPGGRAASKSFCHVPPSAGSSGPFCGCSPGHANPVEKCHFPLILPISALFCLSYPSPASKPQGCNSFRESQAHSCERHSLGRGAGGGVRVLPPGSRCKETAVGGRKPSWQLSRAWEEGEHRRERWTNGRTIMILEAWRWREGGSISTPPPLPRPGNWLAGLAKSLSCYPGPAHPDLGRTFCKLRFMIPS